MNTSEASKARAKHGPNLSTEFAVELENELKFISKKIRD